GKFGASMQIKVPAEKEPIAVRNSARVVNFWIRKAVTGIITPLTSMKMGVSHCAVLAEMPRSRKNTGSAVASRVWFNMATNAPESRTASTTFRFTGRELSAPGMQFLSGVSSGGGRRPAVRDRRGEFMAAAPRTWKVYAAVAAA